MTLRIGLMGCGVVASYGHLPAIHDTPGLSIAALYDPNPINLHREADRYGVARRYTDPDLFLDSGLDAVVITSPAPAHLQNVLDCAKRALPVLCEKPLAMTPSQGRKMIAAMKRAKAFLAVGFCYRFSPCALEIHRMIREGVIGDVRSMRLVYNWDCHGKYYRPDPHNRPDHWVIDPRREGRMHEGGPMVDCGTHQIDLARWWTGSEVARFQSHGVWVDEYEAPDHMYLHMDHESGAHTMVEISYSYGHTTRDSISKFVYEIIGTNGMIRYDRNFSHFEMRNQFGTHALPYYEEKNFHGMYEAFERALREGEIGEMLCTAEQAIEVTRIARTATDDAIANRLKSSR